MKAEENQKAIQEPIAEGSIVLYKLSDYERANHAGHVASSTLKHSPQFSRPCRVIKASPTNIWVRDLWDPPDTEPRQVPRTQVRPFPSVLPSSLKKIALESIQFELPRFSKYRSAALDHYSREVRFEDQNITTQDKSHPPEPKTVKRRREAEGKRQSGQGGDCFITL
eukprot:GHVN01018460.1.p1 GENE.GHVN01018460.1~~GHVN01018460.1.p1  ORF type:complete len:195 (+),score=12.26 GHVN01018460.1:86-586(+)